MHLFFQLHVIIFLDIQRNVFRFLELFVLFIFSVSVVMSSSPVVISFHTAVTVEVVVISSFMFASRRFGCSKMDMSSRICENRWSVSLSFLATRRLGCSKIDISSLICGDRWSLSFSFLATRRLGCSKIVISSLIWRNLWSFPLPSLAR